MSFDSVLHKVEHVNKSVDQGLEKADKDVDKAQEIVQEHTGNKPQVQSGGGPPVEVD